MKFSKLKLLAGVIVLLAASPVLLLAESINPPTTPQTAPMTAQEKKNLETALTWWREVIQSRHLDLTPKYQAENYIQHNPNINTGRAEFVKFFGTLGPAVNPIPEKMANPPVVSGAKGDFVWLIWERENKDPRNPDNTYHFNTFDVIRFENGKIQEHWEAQPERAAGPRRLQDVHEPRAGPCTGTDQGRVEEPAGAHTGQRPLFVHDVGPQGEGPRRSQ